jgi:hypothetical protein
MPRLACKDAQELRFTLGDFERTNIIKPLKKKLEYDTYLEYAKVFVWPVAMVGSAWFIGKGIAGVWDDFVGILPLQKTTDPESGEVTTEWSWTGLPTGPLGEWLGFGKVL